MKFDPFLEKVQYRKWACLHNLNSIFTLKMRKTLDLFLNRDLKVPENLYAKIWIQSAKVYYNACSQLQCSEMQLQCSEVQLQCSEMQLQCSWSAASIFEVQLDLAITSVTTVWSLGFANLTALLTACAHTSVVFNLQNFETQEWMLIASPRPIWDLVICSEQNILSKYKGSRRWDITTQFVSRVYCSIQLSIWIISCFDHFQIPVCTFKIWLDR